MIKNVRIHNILDIIEISKSMEPNKCIPKNIYEIFHFKCFFINFQSLMGPRKLRCDVLSGTTQG